MGTKLNIAREIATLKRMTVTQLRGRYLEVFGERTRSGNKDFLWKRIAWRMQANTEGDLTERARRRAEGTGAAPYAQAWEEILARPIDEIARALVDPSEEGRARRQASPFAGALDARTRWRIHRRVREESERQ